MIDFVYPQITEIQVVAARPNTLDTRNIEFLQNNQGASLDGVAYIVKIYLDEPLPVMAQGFDLYVDGRLIRKYFVFSQGIYFKVYDPSFFSNHGGREVELRITGDVPQENVSSSTESVPTLPNQAENAPATLRFTAESIEALPTQEEILAE